MEGAPVVCPSTHDAPPDGALAAGSVARRARVRSWRWRLAAAITPLMATIVTAAPAFAWPECAC